MDILQAIILGIIQGLTEFIPVSSSGHLTIVPYLLGWPTPSLTFDLALHAGTLFALLWFFRIKIFNLLRSLVNWRNPKGEDRSNLKLILNVVIATVPAAIIGFLVQEMVSGLYKSEDPQTLQASIIYTATALIVVGALFIISDYTFKQGKKINLEQLSRKEAFAIGVAQALALFRGVSRSGITLLAGQTLKLNRVDAAEFAFLMSIPIMIFTTVLSIKDLFSLSQDELSQTLAPALVGALAAFISGSIAIKYLLKFLRNHGLKQFGWYRLLFGLVTLILVLT
jgi:undecaprenyl-diphosphatase